MEKEKKEIRMREKEKEREKEREREREEVVKQFLFKFFNSALKGPLSFFLFRLFNICSLIAKIFKRANIFVLYKHHCSELM